MTVFDEILLEFPLYVLPVSYCFCFADPLSTSVAHIVSMLADNATHVMIMVPYALYTLKTTQWIAFVREQLELYNDDQTKFEQELRNKSCFFSNFSSQWRSLIEESTRSPTLLPIAVIADLLESVLSKFTPLFVFSTSIYIVCTLLPASVSAPEREGGCQAVNTCV